MEPFYLFIHLFVFHFERTSSAVKLQTCFADEDNPSFLIVRAHTQHSIRSMTDLYLTVP